MSAPLTLEEAVAHATREAIVGALRRHRGHRGEAAAALAVSGRTLARLLAEHVPNLEALAGRHGWERRGGEGLRHDRRPR